jgi:hypothetical protein
MEARVELTGGCSGHFGGDDRCYCDSPDVHVEFRCPNDTMEIWVQHGRSNGRYQKNKNFCKQKPLKVGELSDQYSIARWFTENYVPGDKANIF